MNGKLYLEGKDKPIANLDFVQIVSMNDNHAQSPERAFFRTRRLMAGKKMVELYRDIKLKLELEDGRSCNVLFQHSSLDAEGQSVGVLRVLDDIVSREETA